MIFLVGGVVCSKLLTRNFKVARPELWARDVCDGTTPLLDHRFAQPLGVPLPGIRLLDDLVRNHIIGYVVAIFLA
jgi:hypothetical protein